MKRSLLILATAVALVSSCTYAISGRNLTFTNANVMALKVGMTTDEVQAVFGPPDRMKSATCGGATRSGEWPCLMWYYDVEKSSDGFVEEVKTNTLTFNARTSPPRLNDWEIERMW